jgi:hypothetical protein
LTTEAITINVGTTATASVSSAGSSTPWQTWPAKAIQAVSPLTNQVTRSGRTRPRRVGVGVAQPGRERQRGPEQREL